jgi:hypothetical protein
MKNHLVRLSAGVLFVAITIVITETCLNRAWIASPGAIWKNIALIGLLALWVATAGTAFGALIRYDLRQTVLETASKDRFRNDLMRHTGGVSDGRASDV